MPDLAPEVQAVREAIQNLINAIEDASRACSTAPWSSGKP
jgi:hypothetical protein